MRIEISKAQCESMLDFIECNLFEAIRNDVDIDNIEWLQNILDVRRKMRNLVMRR